MDMAHKCMDTAIVKAEFIAARVKNLDLQIPAACCVYHQVIGCIMDIIDRECGKIQGLNANATSKFYDELMASIFGDVLDLVCGRYDNINACNKHLPDLMAQFKEWEAEEKRNNLKPTSRSVLMPMLEVFTKYNY